MAELPPGPPPPNPPPPTSPHRRGSAIVKESLQAQAAEHPDEAPAINISINQIDDDENAAAPTTRSNRARSFEDVVSGIKNIFKKKDSTGSDPRGRTDSGASAGSQAEVGMPFNVQHITNVRPDPESESGFSGLPRSWEVVLKASGITGDDVAANGEAVLDVLKFHMQGPARRPCAQSLKARQDAATKINTVDDPKTIFTNMRKLGQGASGTVYVGEDSRTGERVAIKQCSLDELADLTNEIALQVMSTHPNIVSMKEAYATSECVWIILEYMEGGMLTDSLGPGIGWPEECIAFVCREALAGLAHMHWNHRLHRDIKSDNILIDAAGRVKLADFGFSIGLTEEQQKRTSVVGTPYWMAPELIRGQEYDGKVDVWSMAITALEMADGEPPFMGTEPLRAMLAITTSPPPTLKQPGRFSRSFANYLERSFDKNPETRATAAELLEHPFIQNCGSQVNFSRFLTTLPRRG